MANNVQQPAPATAHGLSSAEIAALALSLAHLGSGPQAATARRAIARLTGDPEQDVLFGDTLTATLATLSRPLSPATAGRARVIAEAITERKVVRLVYGDARANVTLREVEPVTCLVHREHWHFVGWCRMRRGVRAFRFDRLLAVEPTGIPAARRPVAGYLPWQKQKTPA